MASVEPGAVMGNKAGTLTMETFFKADTVRVAHEASGRGPGDGPLDIAQIHVKLNRFPFYRKYIIGPVQRVWDVMALLLLLLLLLLDSAPELSTLMMPGNITLWRSTRQDVDPGEEDVTRVPCNKNAMPMDPVGSDVHNSVIPEDYSIERRDYDRLLLPDVDELFRHCVLRDDHLLRGDLTVPRRLRADHPQSNWGATKTMLHRNANTRGMVCRWEPRIEVSGSSGRDGCETSILDVFVGTRAINRKRRYAQLLVCMACMFSHAYCVCWGENACHSVLVTCQAPTIIIASLGRAASTCNQYCPGVSLRGNPTYGGSYCYNPNAGYGPITTSSLVTDCVVPGECNASERREQLCSCYYSFKVYRSVIACPTRFLAQSMCPNGNGWTVKTQVIENVCCV